MEMSKEYEARLILEDKVLVKLEKEHPEWKDEPLLEMIREQPDKDLIDYLNGKKLKCLN